ncbi:PAP2 superfamily-domain-containing protein [Mycena sp. CBHHK59/15]|nr:PAP2 superfamily-domain-containing protein [Mycena sp. CBHHK59/15]
MESKLKNIVEPLVIIIIFAIGLLVNRHHQPNQLRDQLLLTSLRTSDAEIPFLKYNTHESSRMFGIPFPNNHPFRRNFLSVLLAKFPFALEIWYWVLTYWPYQLMRAFSALYINANPQRQAIVTALARLHASQIISLEEKLGIAIELRFQRYILRCNPLIMTILSDIYLAHFSVGIAFLAYGSTYFPRPRYEAVRRAIALNNFFAFPLLSLWRCAPRASCPIASVFWTMSATSDWANNRFQLTLAAMPSLHFGTSLLFALSIAIWGRHAWLRVLAPMYPVVVGLSVISTANHWVLDCAAGVCVAAAAIFCNRIMLRLRPLEEWVFWLCRTERPRDQLVDDDHDFRNA